MPSLLEETIFAKMGCLSTAQALGCSQAEIYRALPKEEQARRWETLTEVEKAYLNYCWRWYARQNQLAPLGDWATWVIRAGRGFGKTRSGSGWVHERALEQPGRWIALVARTPADARDYMIIGPGGILKNTPPNERPTYVPSNRALIWPNGTRATIYSDEVPDQLRGFSGDTAWLDEFAKFSNPQDVWDNLTFGMRELSSDQPRKLITTTPRPLSVLKAIEKPDDTRVTIASSYENRANVDPRWFRELTKYEGTRTGRQEIHAEIVDDLPGALWTRATLERARVNSCPVEFTRIVVALDPSGTQQEYEETNPFANEVGLIVAGLGTDGHGYVLADFSNTLPPMGWGKRAVDAYHAYKADRIVAEKNFGGAMVETVIRTADRNVPIKLMWASRGKIVRAEPVAALYEQGKVKHVMNPGPDMPRNEGFDKLEDQLCAMLPSGYAEKGSPDRADALVWAITDLMLQKWGHNKAPSVGLPFIGAT